MRKPLVASLALVFVVAITSAFTQQGREFFTQGGREFDRGVRKLDAFLTGYEEAPIAFSTPGNGLFKARINRHETEIDWELTYGETESAVTQAHIHFNARALTGSIVVWFCTNLGNGPVGTPACPPGPATINGTITQEDVTAGAAAAGIAAGELDELIAAMRAGATYANVHTTVRGGGEIRGQIGRADEGDEGRDR